MSKVGEIKFKVSASNTDFRKKMSESLTISKKSYKEMSEAGKRYIEDMRKALNKMHQDSKDASKVATRIGKDFSKSAKTMEQEMKNTRKEADRLSESMNKINKASKDFKVPTFKPNDTLGSISTLDINKPNMTLLKDIPKMTSLSSIPMMTSLSDIPMMTSLDDIPFKGVVGKFENMFKDIDKAYDNFISKIDPKIRSAIKNLGAISFVSLTAAGTKAFKDFESINSELIKRAGLTKDEVNKLTGEISNAYKKGFNVDDIGFAFSNLSVGLKLHGEDLGMLSEQYLKFSNITGEAVTSLVDTGARAMKGWEVPRDDWDNFLNYMLKTSQETGIQAGKALDLISTFSDPLSLIGFDWDESTALVGSLYSSGANIESIMGAMRLAANSLSEAGVKDMRGSFEWIVEDIKESDIADAMEKAGAIFGTRVAADMVKSIKRGDFDIDELMQSIDLSDADIDAAWEESLTLAEKFYMLLREIMDAGRPLGEVMVNSLHNMMPAFESIIGILTGIMEKFDLLPEPLKASIVYFLLFKSTSQKAFDGVLSLTGKFLNLFGINIGSFLTTIASSGLSLKGIMTTVFAAITSPVGLVIAALGLLGFAAYKLKTDFEGTKLFFEQWAMAVPIIFFGAIERTLEIFNLLPKAWNKLMDSLNLNKFKIDPLKGSIEWAESKKNKAKDTWSSKKEQRKERKEDKKQKELEKKAESLNRKTKEDTLNDMNSSDIKNIEGYYDSKSKRRKEDGKEEKKTIKEKNNLEEEAGKRAIEAIKRRNQFLEKTLQTHKDIVKSLEGYVGVFDKITNKDLRATNPYKLLKNAEMREKAYKQRDESLAILEQRGLSRELIDNFRQMGIGDLGNITGLAKLSDSQLNTWLRTQASIQSGIEKEATASVIQQIKFGDIKIETKTDDPREHGRIIQREVYDRLKGNGTELLSF